ncbi:MAG TPA: TetR family transcriptional regulator [Lachnospiraceae bacterium]|nr:TetR family transcriptional regulator [Lachnospiraceae bacterium]
MTTKIRDERYQTAEEAIFDAFFLLIREKPMDKISVSDVIKKAGVVRSTFYNHFENIPDMIAGLENKILNDISEMMNDFHAKNDTEFCIRFFSSLCNYTKDNPYLIEMLSSPAQSNSFFEKMLTMLHNYVTGLTAVSHKSEEEKEQLSYGIACAIGATIGILHKWTRDQCRVPTETIARLLAGNFVNGVLPMIS